MKKSVLFTMIVASLLSVTILKAQTTVTITAGGLRAALAEQTETSTLNIKGTMDARDFLAIRDFANNFSTLTTVDLSAVTKIEAFVGTGGTLDGNVSYPGNEIPAAALWNLSSLTNVVLPSNSGITSIGERAFFQCRALSAINIPEGVRTIGIGAFSAPNGAKNGIKKITLPNSVTTLESSAFKNSNIEEIVLSNALVEIKESAFASTALKSISIPASVTRIENNAFNTAESLTSINIPLDSKLEWLGGVGTFTYSKISNLQLPAGTKIIDGRLEGTFSYTQLGAFKIPKNVTEITNNTFSNTPIKSIEIPQSVTVIGEYAFSGASELETLEIPEKVVKIGEGAFYGLTGLKKVIVHNPNPNIFDTERWVFEEINKETAILYVPVGKVNDYKNAYLWKSFTKIQEIGSNAVIGEITNFDNITVEKSLTTTIALTAAATGNRPVTYQIETRKESVVTLSGSTLTIVGIGTAKITAKAAGNNEYQATEKTITLEVVDFSWLEEAVIAVVGNDAKVVGPEEAATKFTKFYINDAEVELKSGVADLTDKKGELSLKATTADGSEVIKLKINKQ